MTEPKLCACGKPARIRWVDEFFDERPPAEEGWCQSCFDQRPPVEGEVVEQLMASMRNALPKL